MICCFGVGTREFGLNHGEGWEDQQRMNPKVKVHGGKRWFLVDTEQGDKLEEVYFHIRTICVIDEKDVNGEVHVLDKTK